VSHILEIDGTVLHESEYIVEGEDIKVKHELLGGEILILYTLNEDQLLLKYEVYITRKTAPMSSLLWESQVGVNVDIAQAEMLRGNLPQYTKEFKRGI